MKPLKVIRPDLEGSSSSKVPPPEEQSRASQELFQIKPEDQVQAKATKSRIDREHTQSHDIGIDLGPRELQTSFGSDNSHEFRRKLFFLVPVVILLITFVCSIVYYEKTIVIIKSLHEEIKNVFDTVLPFDSHETRVVNKDKLLTQTEVGNRVLLDEPCENIFSQSTSAGPTVMLSKAECHLLTEEPEKAFRLLKPFINQAPALTPGQVNNNSDLSETYLIAGLTLMQTGRVKYLKGMNEGRCGTWNFTPPCMTKIMLHALNEDARLGNKAVKTLQHMDQSNASPRTKTLFYFLAAKLATIRSSSQVVEALYRKAMAEAPANRPALKKLSYEGLALFFLQKRRHKELINLAREAEHTIRNIPASIRWKLRFLRDLAVTEKAPSTLNRFLRNQQFAMRARHDRDLVESLGIPAFQYNLAKPYRRLIVKTVQHQEDRLKASPQLLRRLKLWESRSLIAQGNFEFAVKSLVKFEKSHGLDRVSAHLKGVSLMRTSANVRFQAVAAKSFRTSMRQGQSFENLFGLAVTLVRVGSPSKAKQFLNKARVYAKSKSQKFWLNYAQAEYFTAAGRPLEAIRILKGELRFRPRSILALQALSKAYRKAGKTRARQKLELMIDEILRTRRSNQDLEYLSSPIGPLAMLR